MDYCIEKEIGKEIRYVCKYCKAKLDEGKNITNREFFFIFREFR